MRFVDLQIDTKFKLDNQEYIKIPEERISCCKVLNAKIISTNEKVQIVPITEVEVIN
jgi:hypothetical protein